MGLARRGETNATADADIRRCAFCRGDVELADAREIVIRLPNQSRREYVMHASCIDKWRQALLAKPADS